MQQVQDEALEQATALTGMVSRATASGMLERDYGALELFLGGLMTLPGVQMAELVHPGGDVAMRTQRTAAGQVLSGSISDAMLPYDATTSTAPLAPRKVEAGEGAGEEAASGAESGASSAVSTAASSAPDPAPSIDH